MQLLEEWILGDSPTRIFAQLSSFLLLSSYYAFCGSNHLHKDSDIVILEFDVNDQP